MISITQQDILAHTASVKWAFSHQVEQDLLLCHAMTALFNDHFLSGQIAMRGGTLLHKVHLAPAARYSEDIDLVVVGTCSENDLARAIRRVLKPVLEIPVKSTWAELKLAIRNLVQPSKILRLTYRLPSVSDPRRTLCIIVETNVTERTSFLPAVEIPFAFSYRESTRQAMLKGFEIHEMLGTKMRALFQRSRGRDLFDLYWALTRSRTPISSRKIIVAFQHYLEQESNRAPRSEFMQVLDRHLQDGGFCSDMNQLLRTGIAYNPQEAGEYVKKHLLSQLPR